VSAAIRVEFLGSGGAGTIPRPGCRCRVCAQARERGVPYSRGGPSVFVHGPDVLIDTPEEIKHLLERSTVDAISGCFYSHWHPDHTLGWRMWETRNSSFPQWPPRNRCTDIYLPQQVGIDFRQWLGLWESFSYMQGHGFVRVLELADGEVVEINGFTIRPFRLAEDYVYAFLFEDDGRRVLIAPDETFGWTPPEWLGPLDLAVLPMGLVDVDPFSGERRIASEHPILREEATYAQTLEMVAALRAERVILTHIEEANGLSHDDLLELQRRLQAEGLPVEFAHDTMVVEVE
jgi:phosphoribosyl 1,2-cyclic phosphate phosphodiesterase